MDRETDTSVHEDCEVGFESHRPQHTRQHTREVAHRPLWYRHLSQFSGGG
ncbi:hypothetical protein [Haloferax sp. DFSO60]